MCERGLSEQTRDGFGLRLSERSDVVDDLDEVAACRPIARVIGEGLLLLDRPVDMYAEASLGLCGEVGFERRAGPTNEPLELGSLCGVKSGG